MTVFTRPNSPPNGLCGESPPPYFRWVNMKKSPRCEWPARSSLTSQRHGSELSWGQILRARRARTLGSRFTGLKLRHLPKFLTARAGQKLQRERPRRGGEFFSFFYFWIIKKTKRGGGEDHSSCPWAKQHTARFRALPLRLGPPGGDYGVELTEKMYPWVSFSGQFSLAKKGFRV